MDIQVIENVLAHYGILGMRWGVRKGRGSPTAKGSRDYQTSRRLKKKGLNNLSNDELSALTKRMQLEKQYKDLTKANISSGKKFVNSVISEAGKNLASKYVSQYAEVGIKALGEAVKKKVQ